MRIVPESTINLYSGVSIDDNEQLVFSSVAKQTEYFTAHLVRSETPCTFIKKTGEVRVSAPMSVVKTCNYISFVNPSLDNIVYYARLLDYDYVNNETTSIVYEIDDWQSNGRDASYEDMYIEREHLSEELWDIAEANPYDIRIPEFRTSETLPINNEVEKFYYEISDDYSSEQDILDPDGYKIGKVIEADSGATDKLGLLVKLSNIDFSDLDSGYSVNEENWDSFKYELISGASGSCDYSDSQGVEITVASLDVRDYIDDKFDFVRLKVTLQDGSATGSSINYLVGIDGTITAYSNEFTSATPLNPYADGDYRITAQMVSGYLTLKAIIYSSGFSFDYTYMVSETSQPSKIFDEFLVKIQVQHYGFWRLPNSVYDYLKAEYHANDNTFGKYRGGTGWNFDGATTTPYIANSFRNECIYIYDEDGGTSDEILSELLSYLIIWGCVSSIVDMVVIPNNYMLMSGADISTRGVWSVKQKTVKTELNVVNKKLMLYPFSYLRVETPNGDIKELHFEDFLNVRNGGDSCYLSLSLDISDKPILMLAPYQYKRGGTSNVARNDCNMKEAVFYKQFPTAPYNIDSYLAQVSSYAMEVIKSNTLKHLYDYAGRGIDINRMSEGIHDFATFASIIAPAISGGSRFTGGSGTEGLGSLAQGAVGGAVTAMNQYGYGAELELRRKQYEREGNERANVSSYLKGDISGAIGQSVALTRSAYACDQYVPSNGVGTTNFNVMSNDDVIYQRVTLNEIMLERFDKFFSNYGFTSGRCGIPRVIRFMQGLSTDIPHWITLNGKPTTYIKTMDCRVIHTRAEVAKNIKRMFDSGIRMIKGDLS